MSYKAGTRFGVYGADSKGDIIESSKDSVTYRFDHAPEQVWGMERAKFEKISFPLEVATQ